MKKEILFAITSLLLLIFFSSKAGGEVRGRFLVGSNPSKYEIGVVSNSDRNGKVAFLKSKSSKVKKGFGTIMQTFNAKKFLWKKMTLTGFIKSRDVNNWSGMWMRVHNARGGV